MANTQLAQLLDLPIPENQTKESLKFLSDQLNLYEVGSKEFIELKEKLIELGIPKDTPDKYFGIVVTHWYEELLRTTKEAERPKSETQTTPSNLEEQELERQKRETSEKEALENAKREVDLARQKLEEIQVEKDKKLNVKVTPKEEVKLTEKEHEVYEAYKEFSKQDPQQAVKDLGQEIENRVGEDLKTQGFSDEEINVATTETATQLVENFIQTDNPNYIPQTYHTAVLAHVAKNNQLVGTDVSESAKDVATTHLLQYQMYKDITKSAFGENFANKVFGVDADKVEVTFSETPQAGYVQTFSPYQVAQSNQQILDNQSQSMALVKEFGVDHAKGILLKKAGSVIERRIALLTPQSAAGKLLQSVEAKSLLFSTFGVGAPIKWEATNLIERLALKVAPDYVIPVISGIGKATGINFGITGSVSTGVKVAGQVAGKTAGQAVGKVVATTAVKTGLAATLSATFAAAGSWLPIIGNIIRAAVGWLVGKIFENPKVKKFIKEVLGPLLLVGGGFMFGAPVLGLAAGGLAFGFARGAALAGIGAGIWGFFGAIGSAFVITIGTPIIITLLVIPPLVAFIMFVINSGAYLVPPAPSGGGGGVVPEDCLEPVPAKPTVTNVKFSSDGNYAFPTAPFEVPGYSCFHWDGNKSVDIFSPQTRPPIVAYESGIVTNVTLNDSLGGKYIILKGTTSGRYYYYAHLCQVFVSSSETVKVGDVMATMDETGSGRVQHLHYAIEEPPLVGSFVGGDGNVCPQKDFEEKFGFGVCNVSNYCVSP